MPVFTETECCKVFLEQLTTLNQEWPAKLICCVLMPDHFHFISNPRDGKIIEFCRDLKSKAAKAIIKPHTDSNSLKTKKGTMYGRRAFTRNRCGVGG